MPRFKFIDKSILLKQITNYHFNSNSTTLIESTKLASRQLQWLEESIDDGESSRVKGNIGEQLKLMVHEFTVLNKPLAYIIGKAALPLLLSFHPHRTLLLVQVTSPFILFLYPCSLDHLL